MGDFLNSLSADQKGNLITQSLKVVPAIIGFNQARKAKDQQQQYLDDIKTLEQNRQKVVNPYTNVTNPYANLQVATKAAEMQAEQSDIALANTLDNLRETGAGGATALAQAALKSKQGISASIQKQEAMNQQLQAKGQQQMEMAQAKGEAFKFQTQERRDLAQLDRLQGMADIEANRRQQGFATGVGSLVSGISGSAQSLINPEAQDFGLDTQADNNTQDFNANITTQNAQGDDITQGLDFDLDNIGGEGKG
tara:strand:- start:137 stop:892 length:756 start_codon:yes stop_codon:yes gene_type:complete